MQHNIAQLFLDRGLVLVFHYRCMVSSLELHIKFPIAHDFSLATLDTRQYQYIHNDAIPQYVVGAIMKGQEWLQHEWRNISSIF